MKTRFAARDLAEIAVGACVMAFPVAATQEVWDLSEELSVTRVLLFALASLFFLTVLILLLHHRVAMPLDGKVLMQRVLSTYGVTLVIVALLLFGLDKLDVVAQPWVSLKRTILVAFPASFAATVVDSMRA